MCVHVCMCVHEESVGPQAFVRVQLPFLGSPTRSRLLDFASNQPPNLVFGHEFQVRLNQIFLCMCKFEVRLNEKKNFTHIHTQERREREREGYRSELRKKKKFIRATGVEPVT